MKCMVDLICIAVAVTFIVDLSGSVDSLKRGIKYILSGGKFKDSNYRLLPLDCSLCMTWWTCLIYLLCVHQFTIPMITVVAVLSFCTDRIGEGLLLFKDIILKVYRLIRVLLGI